MIILYFFNVYSFGRYYIPLQPTEIFNSLSFVRESDKRKDILQAYSKAIPQNQVLLQDFVTLKHAYANLLGYSNYAEYAMYNSLIQKASSLQSFLESFIHSMQPIVSQSIQTIYQYQQTLSNSVKELQWWDLSLYKSMYYGHQYKLTTDV